MKDIARPDIRPAFAERNVPVALATDENFLPYLKVAINSAIASSPGSNLDIIVLCAGLPEDAIRTFVAGYAGVGNASVRFVDISEELEASGLSDYKQTARLPLSSCYRLLLPRILPAYGKIVYIDVDVAVCRDLGELYATDVGDSWFAAAKDIVESRNSEYLAWAAKWGFTEYDGYVNAGVLVMNLERFRREPVLDRLKDIVFEAAKWNCDQDALNFVCKGAIAPLDSRWNVQLGDYCISKQIALTGDEMWIAHFTAGQKPWKYPVHRYSHLWWRHVDYSDDFSVVLWRSAFDVADTVVSKGEGIAVSVIVPIYNAETYLVQMLVSLAAQTLRNIEVICVDDGSTDGSGAICERFAAVDSRFKILHQTNSGAAVARNRGIDEARGRWLFFADADDFCRPDMLARMVARGDGIDAEIVAAGRYVVDVGRQRGCSEVQLPECFSMETGVVDRTSPGFNVFSGPGFAPWNKLYNADFVRRTGLRFHQIPSADDVFFVLATLLTAKRIALTPVAYYYYRTSIPTSQIGQADKTPTNFIVALREVRELVAACEEKVQREFYAAAISSCFANLMLRRTKSGRDATYAALCDGGLDAMKLPLANEDNVDLGIYRELVEMAKARVDVVEIAKNYYVRQLQRAEAENDRLRKSDAQNRDRIAKLQGLVDVHMGRISNAADIIKRKDASSLELKERMRQLREAKTQAIASRDARIRVLLDQMRQLREAKTQAIASRDARIRVLLDQMRQLREAKTQTVASKDARIAELLAKGLEYRQKIASLSQTDGKNRKLSAILANIENIVKE